MESDDGGDAPASAQDELIDCPVLGDAATPAECRHFTAIYRNARQGVGGVDFPREMTRGETRTVSFVVSRAGPGGGPTPTDLLGSAPTEEFKLKVARRMAALLQGDGFKITPDGLQTRNLGIGDGARWDWQVTALKAPRHALTLSAFIVAKGPDGAQSETLLQSKSKTIPVAVTWMQWFEDFVAGVVALSGLTKTLIAALAAVVAALIAFRKQLAELFGRRPLVASGAPK